MVDLAATSTINEPGPQERAEAVWLAMPEVERRRITKWFLKEYPQAFDYWSQKAGYKSGGFRPHNIAERKGDHGSKLDHVFFAQSTDCIAQFVLKHFFVDGDAQINSRFLVLCSADKKGKDPNAPLVALAKLREELPAEQQLISLFEATLRWLVPEWFLLSNLKELQPEAEELPPPENTGLAQKESPASDSQIITSLLPAQSDLDSIGIEGLQGMLALTVVTSWRWSEGTCSLLWRN